MTLLMKKSVMMTVMLVFFTLIPKFGHAASIDTVSKIDQFIEEQQATSKIPGISVIIVDKGKTVYQKGFGFADMKTKTPVTSDTLFELGSTSKAFTGLAILQLEKQGLLKRSDDVRKYIPWLTLTYNGEDQAMTIQQLLSHTSGIPSNSITRIPESTADNALELTVKTLLDQSLNRQPGSSFEYATINYDVLGLVIEQVAKQPFDQYIQGRILQPVGMNQSFVGIHQVHSTNMASGYKIGLLKAQPYIPPIYRGNIPAGYIISNANDIARWLKLQLGNSNIYSISNNLIQESHTPDLTVEPFDTNTYYANGWAVMEKDKRSYIYHAGENPTFSSYFIMQPEEQIGVAILANINTSSTTAIGQGVMDLWEGKTIDMQHISSYQKLDKIVTIICAIIIVISIIFCYLLVKNVRSLYNKQRGMAKLNYKRILLIAAHTVLVATMLTAIFITPNIVLGGLNWTFIKVWAPTSITFLLYSSISASFLYLLLGFIIIGTKKNI
ncbi:serine hydrolase domain-containing protein [Lysinibacillus boronitolerans]|uniref:serine hydrolase domain-containing protein n=1 Tax=Lysinibacillus boronitolerans TaxID=309788 RepID=UPI0003073DF9|nr:serine hydrolase domain-containing protein [Lysinibacillus boronitolerans]